MMQFKTEADAQAWMVNVALEDEPCIDNHRFAYIGDEPEILKYNEQQNDGCCGSFDREVTVGGRLATVGCNYGH